MELSQIFFLFMALLALGFIYLNEKRHESPVPLAVRLLAGALAVGALLGLVFPLSYPTTSETATPQTDFLIFTRGTPEEMLRTSTNSTRRATTDTTIAQRYNIPFVRDWPTFIEHHRQAPFAIHGYGIVESQLNALDGRAVTFHPAPIPSGFVSCDWVPVLQAATRLSVNGQYHNTTAGDVKIILLSASIPVDSFSITEQGIQPFNLSHMPKQTGNTLFELAAISGIDTIQFERLPVSITPPRPLEVAMLAAAPSFEYKFITNWFEQLHYQITSRIRISSGKFSTSRINGAKLRMGDYLAPGALDDVDLLIADDTELAALSSAEHTHLNRAIQMGMGLIIRLNDHTNRSPLSRRFVLTNAADTTQTKITLTANDDRQVLPPLPTSHPLYTIKDSDVLHPLFYQGPHIVAATQAHGLGRITGITISNSHTWWLQNQQGAYTRLWSSLVDQTIADRRAPLSYKHTHFPTAYSWMELTLESSPNLQATIDQHPYPMRQHEFLPSVATMRFWPTESGWLSLNVPENDDSWLYIYRTDDWHAARDYASMARNEYFFKQRKEGQNGISEEKEENPKKPLPNWALFIAFLTGSAILWYASKDYNRNVI